jgi:hypothetical protein
VRCKELAALRFVADWPSWAIHGTVRTLAIVKKFGLVACCHYLNDDQPCLIDTWPDCLRAVSRPAE